MNDHRSIGPNRRKPTNLLLDVDLVSAARELGINISRASENGLRVEVAQERARRWKEENKEAMEAWNLWVEENGLPLDQYRQF